MLLNIKFFFCFFRAAPMEYVNFQESNQSCSCWPTPQPQQHVIWASSATYTPAHSNARSPTHWVRPGIELAFSWILVGFISAAPQWELLNISFWLFSSYFLNCGPWNGIFCCCFYGCTSGIWNFLGQGLSLNYSCHLPCSCSNARPLTCTPTETQATAVRFGFFCFVLSFCYFLGRSRGIWRFPG